MFGNNELKKLKSEVDNFPMVENITPPDQVLKYLGEQLVILGKIDQASQTSKITLQEAQNLKNNLASKIPAYVHDLARNMAQARNK